MALQIEQHGAQALLQQIPWQGLLVDDRLKTLVRGVHGPLGAVREVLEEHRDDPGAQLQLVLLAHFGHPDSLPQDPQALLAQAGGGVDPKVRALQRGQAAILEFGDLDDILQERHNFGRQALQ